MPHSKPVVTQHLHLLRQQAREDAQRDIVFVKGWHPKGLHARQQEDLLFVAAQVLTVGERPRPPAWRPAGS
jgi:hypothetical protein